ncbi:tetratricopeptide repeat protein, partial [Limnospira platensis]
MSSWRERWQNIRQRLNTPLFTSQPPRTSNPTVEAISPEYLAIWLEILKAKKRGLSRKKVHRIFQKYQDQLDLDFAETITQWFHSQIDRNKIRKNQYLARIFYDFALDIRQFQLGSRANNLEIAVAAYRAALSVYTRDAFPEDWALTQMNLGFTYKNRIRGERKQNLEEAISCYRAALEVYTCNAFPEYWAMTQISLGEAYRDRIQGKRVQNVEDAISCFQAALSVHTRDAFPEYWAMTQISLGLAYRHSIKGEQAQNLEEAISCYQSALSVYTRDAFPEYWAQTQSCLGLAYSDRIRGELAQNLEEAISCYQSALEVYTRDAFPEKWALTQNNLGFAYGERIRGERTQNLEEAISCYQSALEVRTRDAFPEKWALTQICLGFAYETCIKGERAQNLEEAISCYQSALSVYTRDAFPEYWALTQICLGFAYSDRIRAERAQNLEDAISCSRAALEVYTPSSFPLNCLKTGRHLGNLGYTLQNWEIAIEGYDNAIRAVEQSRDWATSPDTKRKILEDALPIYGKMIQACLHLERYDQALLTVERSKSRTLMEMLTSADLVPKNATPQQQEQYRQLNREIAALQQSFAAPENAADGESGTGGAGETGNRGNREIATPTEAPGTPLLQRLLQQRDSLLAQINDPDFNAFAKVQVQLPDFRQLLTPETALIEWYLPQDPDLGAWAFTVTLDQDRPHIRAHSYSADQRQTLDQFNQTYFADYRQPSWYKALDRRLEDLAEHLHLSSLIAALPQTCQRLILIPHLYLHLFPLHALSV